MQQYEQEAQTAYGQFAHGVVGKNPKIVTAIIIVLLIILIIVIVLWQKYKKMYKALEKKVKSGMSNLLTGGNNPQWQNQMGDAGWGGSMHSTHQPGESRVYGASAEGGHRIAMKPYLYQGCGAPSAYAGQEAQALVGVQALDHGNSAKDMTDADLSAIMGSTAY